jgi:hypothetical protein
VLRNSRASFIDYCVSKFRSAGGTYRAQNHERDVCNALVRSFLARKLDPVILDAAGGDSPDPPAVREHTAEERDACGSSKPVKLGCLKFVGQWSYFMCIEHFRLLSDDDKKYIAKAQGTKSE